MRFRLDLVCALHFACTINWSSPVNHWTPFCKPSPVSAFDEQICHGLLSIFSRLSPAAIFTLDSASTQSILLAKSRIGTRRRLMSWCLSNNSNSSFTTTGKLKLNSVPLVSTQSNLNSIHIFTQSHPITWINDEYYSMACLKMMLPQISISSYPGHIVGCEGDSLICICVWSRETKRKKMQWDGKIDMTIVKGQKCEKLETTHSRSAQCWSQQWEL